MTLKLISVSCLQLSHELFFKKCLPLKGIFLYLHAKLGCTVYVRGILSWLKAITIKGSADALCYRVFNI